MDGLISFGNNRTYDEFKKQISPEILPIFDLLRNFCYSLGENVVEHVRLHRIVFSKSITFRWFADLEPQQDCILIKIQRDRKKPQEMFQVFTEDGLDKLKKSLEDAFNTIH